MTNEEMVKIVKIISTVDGGCTVCVSSACAEFLFNFPEFRIEQVANVIFCEQYHTDGDKDKFLKDVGVVLKELKWDAANEK